MRLFLPLRGKGIKIIIDMIEDLKKFNPPFIDVTSHSSSAQKFQDGQTEYSREKDLEQSVYVELYKIDLILTL